MKITRDEESNKLRGERMRLAELRDLLQAEVLWDDDLSAEVESISAADLMSDVLALSRAGTLLLTGLADIQVVRTAKIADLRAVVFVRGRRPKEETIALARQSSIPLLATRLSMFEACGLLYIAMPGQKRAG